jgi:hypothetical protein
MGTRSSQHHKVYKFVHRTDEFIRTNIKGITYQQEDGWLRIEPNGIIHLVTSCKNGYAWDGCTPKFELLDMIIGTPDGKLDYITEEPITYYASMTHDILYQFKREVPLSRKTTDILFRLIMKDAGFTWTNVYYFFVRLLGGVIFPGWITKNTPGKIEIYECSWITRFYEKFKNSESQEIQDSSWMKAAKNYQKKVKE